MFQNASLSAIFLWLSLLVGIFLVWRLTRAWDIDEEKGLDLTFLTLLGGLISARAYFVAGHFNLFEHSLLNILLVYKEPGFSFWGAFLGGLLTLYIFSRRFKIDFWQAADLGSVAFLGSLVVVSVSVFEAILLGLAFIKIWPKAVHFHIRGKIVSLVFIVLGLIELLMESPRPFNASGIIFEGMLIILGVVIFYRVTKRNILSDFKVSIRFCHRLFTDPEARIIVVQTLSKWWYNQKTSFVWKINSLKKRLRRLYVRSS